MPVQLQKRFLHGAGTLAALCLVMVAALVWEVWFTTNETTPTAAEVTTYRLVIDPGHGGEDGGASSPDGTLVEKDLNLAVAQRMEKLADLLGIPALLTRNEDTLLYDRFGDLSDYTGKKKTYDLRNRLRIAQEHPDAAFCSIHMNKFPTEECQGLQVYFSPHTEKSRAAATLVQTYAKSYLDPGNTRQIKKATSAIYLLNRLRAPAVLVECGFLSSPVDAGKLGEANYQLQLAGVITAALAESLE